MKRTSMLVLVALGFVSAHALAGPVSVKQSPSEIVVSNGLIEFAVSRSTGQVAWLRDLAGDAPRQIGTSLYWDANAEVANPPAGATPPKKGYYRPGPREVIVAHQTPERGEVVVRAGPTPFFGFEVEYHFALFPDVAGLYAYVVFEHKPEHPTAKLWQTRFVLRTAGTDTFQAWSTGSDNLVPIPTAGAVKTLTDATFLLADGTVKTKYQNSVYWSESPVYGVLGVDKGAPADRAARGVWMIEASPEYHNGGPVKQGQTVHDAVLLRVLQSSHFGSAAVDVNAGEQWQKVYGPFLLYVNHAKDVAALWIDAKRQREAEVARWPYVWVDAPAYEKRRGTVSGQLQLSTGKGIGAQVILSDPGVDWTAQSKGYSFWTRTDADGRFTIPKVLPGTYTLHIAGADEPTDFVRETVVVTADQTTDLGKLDWTPVHHGERLWQIGTFDRSAHEFRNGNDARDYQMFTRYPKQFPNDVTYTIGQSDPAKDWNYAHWSWYTHDPAWRVRFGRPQAESGAATLTIAIASAQPASGKLTDLRVAISGTEVSTIALPKTGTAGYRGGVQDSPYNVKTITFDAALLKAGMNELTLRHADAKPFPAEIAVAQPDDSEETPVGTGGPGQVMYDALRLEVKR